MKFKWVLCLLVFCLGCGAESGTPLLSGELIDLTHPFEEETIFWPTEEGFQLDQSVHGYTEAGYFYSANLFCMAEHGGTHIDAPIHFYEGRNTVDQIPLEQLIGKGILVDVSETALSDRNYQVSVEDFDRWESRHGTIPDGAIVLIKTGYGQFWPDREAYMGTAERGADAVANLRFPGLHPEAARWIADNRNIKAIGLDTPSIDYGQSNLFESHQILFEHNIPAFENVANLHLLPSEEFTVIALPMKIQGGSGGPLRIVAILP